MTLAFGITFDYLCPFARNANEHVATALEAGADWQVDFIPFSLAQGHTDEGEPAVWDRAEPNEVSGVLALQVGLVVRDHHPDRFLAVHRALFAARHDDGRDIKDAAVLRRVLQDAGLDADGVFAEVAGGAPLKVLQDEHVRAAEEHQIWGVPTFVTERRAVFVRLMDRPEGDAARATARIRQVVELVDDPIELHEFKQVDLPQ